MYAHHYSSLWMVNTLTQHTGQQHSCLSQNKLLLSLWLFWHYIQQLQIKKRHATCRKKNQHREDFGKGWNKALRWTTFWTSNFRSLRRLPPFTSILQMATGAQGPLHLPRQWDAQAKTLASSWTQDDLLEKLKHPSYMRSCPLSSFEVEQSCRIARYQCKSLDLLLQSVFVHMEQAQHKTPGAGVLQVSDFFERFFFLHPPLFL